MYALWAKDNDKEGQSLTFCMAEKICETCALKGNRRLMDTSCNHVYELEATLVLCGEFSTQGLVMRDLGKPALL